MAPTSHLGQNPKQNVLSNGARPHLSHRNKTPIVRIISAKFQKVNERIAFFKYVDMYGTTLTQGEGTEVPIIKLN